MVRIGISGWTYAPWRGVFYPKKLPHRGELEYASRLLRTIEINGTFYALQRPASFIAWRDSVPEDFIFAVKASRYITHTLRLNQVERPLANFLSSGVLALADKLGPILWQFPPTMKYDEERFKRFLELLPRDRPEARKFALRNRDEWMRERSLFGEPRASALRHAIEVRNESFRNKTFFRLLEKHGAALVVSDSPGTWPYFEELTAEFVYVRLHGAGELHSGSYGERAIGEWARKIRSWSRRGLDVYFYFDNDAKVKAPFDALTLADRVHAGVARVKAA